MEKLTKQEQKEILKIFNHLIKEYKFYKVEQDYIDKEIKTFIEENNLKIISLLSLNTFKDFELTKNSYVIKKNEFDKTKKALKEIKHYIEEETITKKELLEELVRLQKKINTIDIPPFHSRLKCYDINNAPKSKNSKFLSGLESSFNNLIETNAPELIYLHKEADLVNDRINSEILDAMCNIRTGKPRLIRICYIEGQYIRITYFKSKRKNLPYDDFDIEVKEFLKEKDKRGFYLLEKLLIYKNDWVPYENLVSDSCVNTISDTKKGINNETDKVLEKYFTSNKKFLLDKSELLLANRNFHITFMLKAHKLNFSKKIFTEMFIKENTESSNPQKMKHYNIYKIYNEDALNDLFKIACMQEKDSFACKDDNDTAACELCY